MLFISWNINGLTKRINEIQNLIDIYAPDFLCLQKVRSNECRTLFNIDGYNQIFTTQDYGNWSGVSIYAKLNIDIIPKRILTPNLSLNGHLQVFNCDSFALLNTYVPFANQKLNGAVEYRQQWDTDYRSFIKNLSYQLPIIICGDLNIVHTAYDSCEQKLESKRANFTKWERDNFNRLLSECDLVDPYRILHPTEKKPTYFGVWRHLQIGNRIDYFLISRSLFPYVTNAHILSDFGSSQSAPITLNISL